ncbi:hypothetical protein [Brevibacillus sp. Leaf182]|uniref:hypothetical protein n=1 Tax=Brevibacillus sp. Leaf182 TaxID=1736290 RepID=UPI0009E93F05|nr:hypothetical protein [Brevibacillus sp. Leaf182]RAT97338.1 hypothetical protein ASG16_012150 [Brevibacillus sp. Leaf182]
MWIRYQEIRRHPADFRVKYRFYSENEGGRKVTPFQGLGVLGYFMEGARKVAVVEVIEIVGLHSNPTS